MVRAFSMMYFTLLTIVPVFAQDQQDQQELMDKALIISIDAKIIAGNEKATWSFKAVKITIPGKPVIVQLKGKNINVSLVFTPYKEEREQQVLLVAQGQIWLQEAGTDQAKYLTSLKSIPVRLGEKIQFYPLGMGESQSFNIQLEIVLIRYVDFLKAQEKTGSENGGTDNKTPGNPNK